MNSDPPARDDNGRFAPGNRCGKGRPKGLGYELQRAAQEAVTAEHIQAIIRKATMLALQGNIAAIRLVLERTCGRAPEAAREAVPIDLSLPKLVSAADCTAALDLITAAICSGTCDRESAKLLVDLIAARLKAIEVQDLEDRLTELEKSAETLEGAPRRNGRRR